MRSFYLICAGLMAFIVGIRADSTTHMRETAHNASSISGFKAGTAAKVITPEEPMWLAGYASRSKPSEGKQHELYAKALCLEDATGQRLLVVTTDLIGIPRRLAADVATEVERIHGIKRSNLMLTASHTHSGPVIRENLIDMYGLSPMELDKVNVYTRKLQSNLIDVIGSAVKNLEPASLKFGRGKAEFAINRREQTDKGIVIGQNRTGPVDHSVPVLVVEGANGKPKSVVFGYACHNTTLDGYQWSGDYAGHAQINVEKAFPGAVAMFWSGCGADANPHPRRKIELCEQHGRELADSVIGTVKGELIPITGKFLSSYDTISLRFESIPTRAQLTAETLSKTVAVQRRAERLLKELDTNGKIADSYPHYPVQTWILGDQVRWVALGGEVVIDYATRLRKELPTDRTLWVTGYANDVMAYIPSARVLKEGGYEAESSQVYYGMPGKWSSSIEELIVAKVKQQAGLKAELTKPPGPLTPNEELATFKLDEGLKLELVASEPDIVDPVSMCFDETGRLFVCEMRGYPNGGVGKGNESRGRIKCLTDRDGDGRFETCVTFAEGLRFPMGVTPYKDGVIVAVAPDLLYLQDTNHDGKSDRTTVLYTGFNLDNIQQMVNSLQWGLDNWIYGCAGNDGGTIKSIEKPDAPSVQLRNRGFRFKPNVPGSLEPTSSGGQYGLTCDDFQHWFTSTNSQHLRQIVLPDHYLKRNPYLPVAAVTIDIPEHGAAARVFRISPFEPWRVERTMRRAGGADSARFPGTELVPGGYITSACSPLIYTADLLAKQYRGNNFVCDPANNLIHREILNDQGSVFTAVRADPNREFLASTDNWFRPVHLSMGPEGAIYVLDFYREIIETPLSLPDDIKKQLNLESRGRGRIWRIAPNEFKATRLPDFSAHSSLELVDELASSNPWRRLTAQRLLVQRNATDVGERVREGLKTTEGTPARANMLWTLHHLEALQAADLRSLFNDPEPGIREQILRLSEPFLASDKRLREVVAELVNDPSPRVRFQLAFSAGALPSADAVNVLAALLQKDANDPWIVTAALSSSRTCCAELLESIVTEDRQAAPAIVIRLAAMIGAAGEPERIAKALALVAEGKAGERSQNAIIEGLGQGMRGSKSSLSQWWEKPPVAAVEVMKRLRGRIESSINVVRNKSADPRDRNAAIHMLAYGPFDSVAPVLVEQLSSAASVEMQAAALKALSAHTSPKVADLLLQHWNGYGPAARVAVLDALLARPDRALALIGAVESKTFSSSDLSPAHVQQLKSHPNAAVKARASSVLQQSLDANRVQVIDSFVKAVKLTGDKNTGQAVFQKHCSACHKLDGAGHEVGPNLLAIMVNKSDGDLLIAIFDPNREVDPRYRAYQLGTADERVLTGIVATETPTSITLRRAEGAEDVILRTDIDFFRATKMSLMPEGLEKALKQQDVADLLAYLRSVRK